MSANDICIRRADGYYDVLFGVDGWVVLTPIGRYTMSGLNETSSPRRDGWTTRKAAKKFLDTLLK